MSTTANPATAEIEAGNAAARIAAAKRFDEQGRMDEAFAEIWPAYAADPANRRVKVMLADMLYRQPEQAVPEWRERLLALLGDREVEPWSVAAAGWRLLLREGEPLAALADDPAALAARAEQDELLLRLLAECPVPLIEAEQVLTGLRRWLLLERAWAAHPRLVDALAAQAAGNGGTWPIAADERAQFAGTPLAPAYDPPAPVGNASPAFADPVTGAVAGQYERWPYPTWSRITLREPRTVPEAVAALDQGRPSGLPIAAEVLVAGCGTGREAAMRATNFPDAKITAIDLSATSLAYARARCEALGLHDIDFHQLDLHRVAELGKSFDFISCSGVLHHLPDPEKGWEALVGVLRPGGVMQIMVYSSIARLRVRAAQRHIADLLDRPVDADLLREARQRLIERMPSIARSPDFYSLASVHDLVLHRHEDPLDVPRIARAIDRFGLELLAFGLPTPASRARYRAEHPEDPAFRDIKAWERFEKRDPFLFVAMYKFWCRKPAA